MSARRTGLAGILGAMLLVAACGGSAATSVPTPGATAPPATSVLPSVALPSIGLPDVSLPIPSLTPNKDLEAMFPAEVAGKPLTVRSMSGSDFMTAGSGDMGPALQQLGKGPSDLSVAFGGSADGSVVLVAFEIAGVKAGDFLDAFLATTQDSSGTTISDTSLGGKAVKKVVTPDQTLYLYLHGDVIWTFGGTSTDPAVLNDAFSKLP